MSESPASQYLFSYRGSCFDSMIDTLGGAFGTFEAKPLFHTPEFQWEIDLSVCDRAVLLTGYHQDECEFNIEPMANTAEYLSVVIPRNGGMGVTSGSQTAQVGQGKLLLYKSFEPDCITMHGQSNLIDELLINWPVILQAVGQTFELPLNGPLDLAPELDLSTPAGQAIGGVAETIISGMRNNGPLLHCPIAMAHLTDAFADLVMQMVPHRLSHFLNKKPVMIAPRHVRRAIEFMQANISSPMTISTVADAVGVSRRSLEIGFRTFKETTPAAHLHLLRLRAARQELLDPDNDRALKEICLKWGFFHFGRFSAVYRSAYGETPSVTRKRVRGAGGDFASGI